MQKLSQKLRHIRWLRNIRSQKQSGEQPARKRIKQVIDIRSADGIKFKLHLFNYL